MDSENSLPTGWEARLGLNERIYYYSKRSRIVQILPPPDIWKCKYCLPYGWEMAVDYDNKSYYINHVTQSVTYEDPRTEDDQATSIQQFKRKELPPPDLLLSPQPREYLIIRDSLMGFGFIAGSEKPVVVRSVTAGGPSEGKLLPDDQILKIGSENVLQAERERVIQLIREETDQVSLTVLQPNRSANSSFLNPAKKTFRSMDRPKVRFADDVVVNGQCRAEGFSPLLVSPGVLRVELETKETRSFQFDPDITAGDAVASLCEEIGFKDSNFFSLVIASPPETEEDHGSDKSVKSSISSTSSDHSLMTSSSPDSLLVAPWDSLSKIVNNPSVRHHYCYLRLEFMPRDVHKLARNDPEAFRYLYVQCVNDVVAGDRYKNDLTHEDFVKLAVLQMQELVLSSMPSTPPEKRPPSSSSSNESPMQKNVFRFPGLTNKLTLKYFEKEYGLRRFLPASVLDAMKKDSATAKYIKKMIQQYLKASYNTSIFNQPATSPIIPTSPILFSGGNADTALFQLRLQYLKILSPQHLFGGRFFNVSMLAVMETDVSILVGHHYGISQLINAKTRMVSVLSEFQHVKGVEVAPCRAESRTTQVKIQFSAKKDLLLAMERQDAHNFAFMVSGYCKVYGNIHMVLTLPMSEATSAPVYFGPHKVKSSYWNYPSPHVKIDADKFSPAPASFYCDFSEPITPSLLSQDTAPLNEGVGKRWHPRPPTPPVKMKSVSDDDEPDVEDACFEYEDANNNESNLHETDKDVVYQEITTSTLVLPDSPPASTTESATDLSAPNPRENDGEMPEYNGYLLPSPPSERSGRFTDNARHTTDDQADSDGPDDRITTAVNENTTDLVVNTQLDDVTMDEHVHNAALPSPPNYPAPRRKEVIRKDTNETISPETRHISRDDSGVSDLDSKLSSFERHVDPSKLSALPQTSHLDSSTSRTDNADSPNSQPLEEFQDVDDPATIQRLQETEDLIQYFRQKHQEIVGESGDAGSLSPSGDFVSDLAAGSKRLRRAEKAAIKNRKSWAGVENAEMVDEPGFLSMSTPDLPSMSKRKKRHRGIFRKFFGDRRKKPLSMYDATPSSAYGRRKRRFRMPKLRLKKAFSLSSTGKSGRKSVLADAEIKDKSASSRFRFFGSKKSKSYGMLVISEPCDVRGVDLLPKGKYTVAGTMFSGDTREPKVITVGSKENSLENLTEIGLKSEVPPSRSTSNVPLRPSAGSLRVSKRPVSFSTFQQSDTLHSPSSGTDAGITEQHRSNSELLGPDQLSPCELSQTESAEAIHEIVPNVQESFYRGIVKPPRKSTFIGNTAANVSVNFEDSVDSRQSPVTVQDTSTEVTKKKPSYKRPAPPPPIQPAKKEVVTEKEDDIALPVESLKTDEGNVDAGIEPEQYPPQSDSEDESRLFDPRSDDSMSLVTEIFSYLQSNNDGERAAAIPELPDDDDMREGKAEDTLLYDHSYVMPGVKADAVMEVTRIGKEPDSIAENQQVLYDMFYNEMIADNSRLTLHDPESSQDEDSDSCASDASDQHRQGSYDVTHSEASDGDDDVVENGDVTLKYYASSDEYNSVTRQNGSPIPNGLKLESMSNDRIVKAPSTSDSAPLTPEENHITEQDGNDSETGETGTNSGGASSSYTLQANHPRSVFSYGNLITPSGYHKSTTGAKRTPLSPKPPLPPKPVFH